MNRVAASQEFWAGIVFLIFGAGAVALAQRYELGTAAQMGPGYFPTVVGSLLFVLGAVSCVRSLAMGGGKPITLAPWRSILLVPASVLVFAGLVDRVGLVVAVMVAVLISSFAAAQFRPREAIVGAIVLAAFASLLFVYLIGIPMETFALHW